MSKRKLNSGGSVTGGTGDVKPQVFTMNTGTAPAIDDYVINTTVLPVPRFGTMKTKATVFEILWVDWYLNIVNIQDNQATEIGFLTTNTNRSDGETSTLGSFAADLLDPRTFAPAITSNTLTTSGAAAKRYPIRINMTDSNGNGMLIATDRLVVVGGGVGNATAGDYVAKVGYRMTNIGIAEYVGIVQSQQ
ncbi:hypothetical protein LCGC14_2844120 [marine sediment metagenome]|uniref:Uncharacterized protein n=1 Tax=marine sediment metagenome TaxID=412755 RepID=A0A0F9AIX2_9ZZZZ